MACRQTDGRKTERCRKWTAGNSTLLQEFSLIKVFLHRTLTVQCKVKSQLNLQIIDVLLACSEGHNNSKNSLSRTRWNISKACNENFWKSGKEMSCWKAPECSKNIKAHVKQAKNCANTFSNYDRTCVDSVGMTIISRNNAVIEREQCWENMHGSLVVHSRNPGIRQLTKPNNFANSTRVWRALKPANGSWAPLEVLWPKLQPILLRGRVADEIA